MMCLTARTKYIAKRFIVHFRFVCALIMRGQDAMGIFMTIDNTFVVKYKGLYKCLFCIDKLIFCKRTINTYNHP